jgi:hypothetical protein
MTKPTVFISHRHADKAIAEVVATFLDERSAGAATIHCSSHTDFRRPTAGDSLGLSLKRALGSSDVVVLIFTSEAEDWSWCMWECGVATDPHDERSTKVVVLQCGESAPRPYGELVRVDARNLDSLTGFVKTMLTTTDYFPEAGTPLTLFPGDSRQIREFAADLYAKLGDVLSTVQHVQVEERSAAAYFCIELDRDTVAQLRAAGGAITPSAVALVREGACLVKKRGAQRLFSFHVDDGISLSALFDRWSHQRHDLGSDDPATDRWCDSVVEQIITVTCGRFPVVAWSPFAVEPSKAIIPFIAGSRTVPTNGGLQLHLYFVPMSPRPVPVTERMIRLEEMFHKNLSETPGESIRLADLLTEMKSDGRSRVPMLGEERIPKFMVHRSMIQEFITDCALSGEREFSSLTVHDLLVSSQSAAMFRQTFAVVDRSADMDQALAAMNAIPGCQDVFVTTEGTANSAVVGWLTNTMYTA